MVTLKDIYQSGWGIDGSLCVLVVGSDGEKVALSEVNLNGGCCDCCRELEGVESLEVLRLVDLNTMQEWDLKELDK